MFRPMRRFKQQLTVADCFAVLQTAKRGVLAVHGDDGYPYAVPLNFVFDPDARTLYFHMAVEGHKLDAIRRCDKVSFCVMDEGFRREGEWALNIRSVIVFGRIKIVEDRDRALDICRRLSLRFTSDIKYIEDEISGHGDRVLVFELIPEHMTGKLVNEA